MDDMRPSSDKCGSIQLYKWWHLQKLQEAYSEMEISYQRFSSKKNRYICAQYKLAKSGLQLMQKGHE